MNDESLRRKAYRYRSLARGINDEKTITLLEEMACELEARAAAAAVPICLGGRAVRRKTLSRKRS